MGKILAYSICSPNIAHLSNTLLPRLLALLSVKWENVEFKTCVSFRGPGDSQRGTC